VSRAPLYLVPALCLGLVTVVLLGPGRAGSAFGARVRGAPVASADVLALRIGTVERRLGAEDPAPGALRVEARSGDQHARWEGATDGDALAEVTLRAEGGWGREIVVRVSRGDLVLAEGSLVPDAKPPRFQRESRTGAVRGELVVDASVARGQLAAPFASTLRLGVTLHGARVAGASLTVQAEGAEVRPASAVTGDDGLATVELTPQFGDLDLRVDAKAPGGEQGSFEGPLRVVPGAMLVTRSESGLRVSSPAPRRAAYLSFVGAKGRIGGATVMLEPGRGGLSEGTLDAALVPTEVPLAVVVGSDPGETGLGTVTWPLRPDSGQPDVAPLRVLLDGVPAAEAQEEARARTLRRVTAGLLTLAMLLELALLSRVSREANRELAKLEAAMANLSAAGAEGVSAKPLPTTALYAIVALSFLAMSAFLLLR
jgi:hypothetical protein